MKKINSRVRSSNPIFHSRNKKEDDSAVSVIILRQARKTGKLNLSNRHFSNLPTEILSLGDVHSDDTAVNLDDNSDGSNKWWELEPLKYLDLSSNCISSIPAQINLLDSLVNLNLHANNLESVPPELGQLFKLTKLNMAHNKLNDLPIQLTGMKELRHLNLSQNVFNSVPECVYDLVMLDHLDLSRNSLSTMAPGIGFLIRLTHLNLSQNKLTSVPPDISNCRALLDLDLSNNEITTDGLPHLGDLHNMQIIQLQYNRLTLLPKINGCSNLKEIHLGYNKMEEITIEELSTLSHLQVINLRDNKIEKIPKELSCLQNLIRLDLSNNNLTELPATLSLLPHLENLQVEGNSLRAIRRDITSGGTQRLLKYLKQTIPLSEEDKNLVTKLPCHSESGFPDRFTMRSSKSVTLASQSLCNVPNQVFEEALQVPCNLVDLSKNKLTEVPEGLWCLTSHLTDLNLCHNQIKQFPAQVGQCINLQYLNLESNQLESLPEELSLCKRLREVNISHNRFQKLPSCIYEVNILEIFLARGNKMTEIDADGFLKLKYLATLDLSNNNISSVPPLMGKMVQLRAILKMQTMNRKNKNENKKPNMIEEPELRKFITPAIINCTEMS